MATTPRPGFFTNLADRWDRLYCSAIGLPEATRLSRRDLYRTLAERDVPRELARSIVLYRPRIRTVEQLEAILRAADSRED